MSRLGVQEAIAVVREFAARLDANRAVLDELNVFPIADRDTGSNMARTVASIAGALEGVADLSTAGDHVEAAALDGRGNSGLIVGQFLAGFFRVADGHQIELALALHAGAQRAREAVASPVEGTILTVADAAAAALGELPGLGLDALVTCVAEEVEATPTRLAILAERGVVDSGAAGLLLFFEALRHVLGGAALGGAVLGGAAVGGAVLGGAAVGGAVLGGAAAFERGADLIMCDVGLEPSVGSRATPKTHEIQFRVPTSLVSTDGLRSLLVGLGTDVVIGVSNDELAAHLHVVDPHAAAAAISAVLENRPGARAISYDVEPIVEAGGRP